MHEGSTPTMGMPFAAKGARAPSSFLSRFFAPPNCPVVIHVRPQHTSGATMGANPLRSRTSTIERAPRTSSVWLKESAHTTT